MSYPNWTTEPCLNCGGDVQTYRTTTTPSDIKLVCFKDDRSLEVHKKIKKVCCGDCSKKVLNV